MAEGPAGPSNRDTPTAKEPNLTDSTASYVLKITQWSKKRKDKEHGKDDLSADVFCDKVGNQWQLLYNINGNSSVKDDDYLSLFVAIAGREDLPFAWTKHVTFSFTLQHPDDPEDQQNKDGDCEGRKSITSTVKSKVFKGCETTRDWGWSKYQTHQKIEENGFVVDDTVSVLCEISTLSSAYNIEEEDASAYLKLACEKGEVDNVEFCLSEVRERWRGKDASEYLLYTYLNTAVDPSKKSSETALDIAISEKHTQVIKKLLQEGARPSVDSIDRAVKKGLAIEVLKSLLDVEFPDDGSKYTFQALITAAKNTCPCCGDPVHSSGMLRLLLEHGADPNLADKNGNTALVHLAESGLGEDVVLMVDEYQASVERCSKDKRKVLKVKHTMKKQRELKEEKDKAIAAASGKAEDEKNKADAAMLALLAEEDAETERKTTKASKKNKKNKKKNKGGEEKEEKKEPEPKMSKQEAAKMKEEQRQKQKQDAQEAKRKQQEEEEAAYQAALENAKREQREREEKQQKEILEQIQRNEEQRKLEEEKRAEQQVVIEQQMAKMKLQQQAQQAQQQQQEQEQQQKQAQQQQQQQQAQQAQQQQKQQQQQQAARAQPTASSNNQLPASGSTRPAARTAAAPLTNMHGQFNQAMPNAKMSPAGSAPPGVASPNSMDGDAEFAAIWGSQTNQLDDEEEEQLAYFQGGAGFQGGPAGAMPSFQDFQYSSTANMAGGNMEELFWADGAQPGGSSSQPGPAMAPPSLGGTQPDQELFWNASGPPEQAPHGQWPGGGIFAAPGMSLNAHSQQPSWQPQLGGQFQQNGDSKLNSDPSMHTPTSYGMHQGVNWDTGGFAPAMATPGPDDTESKPSAGMMEQGTSPTEYFPQHLMGEGLNALLDE